MIVLIEAERDVREWLAAKPAEAEPGAYPKLMYNVNLPPVIVRDAEHEAAMGEAWRVLDVGLIPAVPPVTITPASASVAAAAGSGTFAVAITGPGDSGTWIAEKDAAADWLTVDPVDPQSDDGDVTYTVTENVDVERTANIYVNGKTFAITQAAGV